MPGRVAVALAAALAAVLVAPTGAEAARGLRLGFFDRLYDAPASERDPWLERSAAAGADIVRIEIGWAGVAPNGPSRPEGFDAREPSDPAYDFARADAAITAADANGLQVLVSFTGAPRWAEGSGRPSSAPPGSWRPSTIALEEYGAALARRYSGNFPDPARPGLSLPRVDAFQVWNEPNLGSYLQPQWRGRRTVAPARYRKMLRAFYRGVKSAGTGALVVTAGTAPFGDPQPGGERIMPPRFVRELLCLRRKRGRLRTARCPAPARFDVLAHHPYSVGSPRSRALNRDDVSIPDLRKLTRLLRKAERSGRALPRRRHRLWVTETSYDSSPPDRDGVAIGRHARFLEQTLYLLWRQGVDTIAWFGVSDQPPVPSFAATNQSGIFFADGRPKPARTAFRFPFVAERAGRRRARVWGRAPIAGDVVIERRTASGWRAAKTLTVGAHGVFLTRVRSGTSARLRARAGTETSLPWRIG